MILNASGFEHKTLVNGYIHVILIHKDMKYKLSMKFEYGFILWFIYSGLTLLKTLELSDTEVASNGLRHLSG